MKKSSPIFLSLMTLVAFNLWLEQTPTGGTEMFSESECPEENTFTSEDGRKLCWDPTLEQATTCTDCTNAKSSVRIRGGILLRKGEYFTPFDEDKVNYEEIWPDKLEACFEEDFSEEAKRTLISLSRINDESLSSKKEEYKKQLENIEETLREAKREEVKNFDFFDDTEDDSFKEKGSEICAGQIVHLMSKKTVDWTKNQRWIKALKTKFYNISKLHNFAKKVSKEKIALSKIKDIKGYINQRSKIDQIEKELYQIFVKTEGKDFKDDSFKSLISQVKENINDGMIRLKDDLFHNRWGNNGNRRENNGNRRENNGNRRENNGNRRENNRNENNSNNLSPISRPNNLRPL